MRLTDDGRAGESGPWYEIRVAGTLDEQRWAGWFGGLELRSERDDVTVIAGAVADQAALHGLLVRVRDLGLELLSVNRMGEPGSSARIPPATARTGDDPAAGRP